MPPIFIISYYFWDINLMFGVITFNLSLLQNIDFTELCTYITLSAHLCLGEQPAVSTIFLSVKMPIKLQHHIDSAVLVVERLYLIKQHS